MFNLLAKHVLVNFHADSTHNQGCGGCDSWNDLACNNLDLVSWSLVDLVVSCSKVGSGGHEVDVAIGVVVLLELYSMDLEVWIGRER